MTANFPTTATLPAGEAWTPRAIDPALRMTREVLLRRSFRLLGQVGLSPNGQHALVQAVEMQHRRNVDLFGWVEAERMRGEAFADVQAAPVPIADAVDSDFADFEAAQGQQA